MRLRTTLPLLLLAACGIAPRGQPADDTAQPEACGEGQVLDSDGSCVPEACGSGTWGEIEGATVFVDIAAAAGGDGSQGAPYTSIQAGLDAAGAAGGGTVAVAAGSYAETLTITWAHAGVLLAGRCRELVTVDASGAAPDTAGIDIDAGIEAVGISGFTVTAAPDFGVLVHSGTVTMRRCAVVDGDWIGIGAYTSGLNPTTLAIEDCEVRGNRALGTLFHDDDTEVTLRDCVIADTLPSLDGAGGYGNFTRLGATTTFERCTIEGNAVIGVAAIDADTTVQLIDSTILDTQPAGDGEQGYGIQAYEGALVVTEGCELAGNSNVGALAYDAGAIELHDSTVRDTATNPYGQNGLGLMAFDGGTLMIAGSELSGNQGAGVLVTGAGTVLDMCDSAILDTATQGGDVGGMAVQVDSGATALIERSELTRSTNAAVLVMGSGTDATIIDTWIRDTQLNSLGEHGYGLDVQDGATLVAQGCELTGNSSASVLAQGEGTTVTLEACTLRDTQPKWEGELGLGIHAQLRASVFVRDSELSGHTTLGAIAVDEGTLLEIERTRVEDTTTGGRYTAGIGVAAQSHGTLVARELTVSGGDGPGLMVSTMGVASCEACVFSGNAFAGAVLLTGSSLLLEGSTIEGCQAQENLGGGTGVYAETLHSAYPAQLVISGSTIQDNAIAGTWLLGDGSYQLVDNTIRGGLGWERGGYGKCGDAIFASRGTTAWRDQRGLLIAGNTLRDSRGAGVFLQDATATLDRNSWQDNGADLITQGAGCEAGPEGLEDEPLASSELCPQGYDYGTCDDEFALVLELAELEGGLRSPATTPPWVQLPPAPSPAFSALQARRGRP
jgi:hypothetical protein